MMYLSQLKKSTAEFINNYPVLTAAAVGYGATHAYSVLNPVGGAILFATFVYNDGLKPKTWKRYMHSHSNYKSTVFESNLSFACKKIKACVMAWGAAYYVTPYANLATGPKVWSAVFSAPGTLTSFISSVASKAFASLLAMPSQMFTSTIFAVNSINLPAVAATVAVVVLVVSLYKLWNHLSSKSKKFNDEFKTNMNARLDVVENKINVMGEFGAMLGPIKDINAKNLNK